MELPVTYQSEEWMVDFDKRLDLVESRGDFKYRAAMPILVAVLWHHARFDRWPSTLELSRMAPWRHCLRSLGDEFLRENFFLIKEKDENGYVVHRVTAEGRLFVTLPSLEPGPTTSVNQMERALLPDDENQMILVNWVYNFYKKNGRWPTPKHYKFCGLYKRSPDEFHQAIHLLVECSKLVEIHIRRGRRQVTRLVDTAWLPEFFGKHDYVYFWSTTQGPFPEP
jgi:hypothetical protein